MNCENLTNIKELIENMEIVNQREILKIFQENNVNISENNNGCFINLSILDKDVMNKISDYIEYFNKQQSNLSFIEEEKISIKKEFFYETKKDKNRSRDKNKSKETHLDNL